MATTDLQVLIETEWRDRARRHTERVEPWIGPRLERRRLGQRHPVDDFLFDYYRHRPAQLRQWHPGAGVALTGDVASWAEVRGYRVTEHGAEADLARVDLDLVQRIWNLLQRTATRPPSLGCFGRHEWAMVYRLGPDEVRHAEWPLRLTTAEISQVVESTPLRCSHFDAFRFYTSAARPLNVVQPTRATQADLEQPGCLHATMDLYQWAYRCYPIVGADLTADCFALAREVRQVDMRAAPYDLTDLGFTPIRIETAEGRAEYVAHQQDFTRRGQTLRAQLAAAIESALTRSGPSGVRHA